jgi:heme-degrading monooxygenase HmoA
MDGEPITLINIFEIPRAQVGGFILGWKERAAFLSRRPGFRSLRLHSALSPDTRYQLVNVAEWDSVRALEAATSQDFFRQSAQRSAKEFTVAALPAIYRVALEATAD